MLIDQESLKSSPLIWIEGILLLAAAPVLLFPTLSAVATAVALLLLAITWLGSWAVTRRPFPVTPFNGVLLLWAFAMMVGILVTADPDLTLSKATGLLLGLALWRYLAVTVKDHHSLSWAVLAFAALGAGLILIGALGAEWRFKVPMIERLLVTLPPRLLQLPEGPDAGISANQLAGTLVLYLPLFTAALFGWRPVRYRIPILMALALVTLLTAGLLLLSQSRTAWLGGIAGLAVLPALWGTVLAPSRLRHAIWVALILMTAVVLLALWQVGPDRIERLWQEPPQETAVGTLGTVDFRKEVWRWSVTGIQDFPFTGTGLGTFRRVVQRFYPIAVAPTYDIAHAHNIFLQVALDVGLPGLVAYLALLGIAGLVGWQAARWDRRLRPLALGLLAGLVALHVYGLGDALAPGSKPGLAFWMALGLLAAMGQITPCAPGKIR